MTEPTTIQTEPARVAMHGNTATVVTESSGPIILHTRAGHLATGGADE
jgi:hypothetical protein